MAYPGMTGGYNHMQPPPENAPPQMTEAWALTEAGRRMALAARDEDNPEGMRTALRLNWRLWTLFQAQLITGGSIDVPEDIRINLLTLCKFIDKHTVGAILDPTREKLSTLVEINRNIAAGLQESAKHSQVEPAAEQAESEAPAAPLATNVVG
jgi:flagellar protein FlaF